MNTELKIRKTTAADVPAILELIKGIAKYEKMEDEVTATEEILHKELFERKNAEVVLAETEDKVVGYALYFHNFSTFLGKAGLYLEDIFVKEEHRGKGYGKQLFQYMVDLANERNCERLEWVVLDWNQPAIDFYESFGAEGQDQWRTFRLSGDELKKRRSITN